MTNHASNVEIEDVLSSIRRLVSEDNKAKPRSGSAPDAPVDALILTPQQRIADAEDADEAAPVEDGSDAPSPKPMLLTDPAPANDVADQAPTSLGDIVQAEVEAALELSREDADEADPLVDFHDEIWTDEADDSEKEPEEASVASDSGAEVEADRAVESAIAPDHAHPGPNFPAPENADKRSSLTLEEKIAELEAMIAQSEDEWESDGARHRSPAAMSATSMNWEDVSAEAPEPAQPQDAPFLDEDALRELVADIVRQELQGALGERITRNVRKLVRREIHRALTTQDFD